MNKINVVITEAFPDDIVFKYGKYFLNVNYLDCDNKVKTAQICRKNFKDLKKYKKGKKIKV